jgi:hypothetical protein
MGQQWGRAGQPASSLKPLGEYTNTILDYYMLYIISAEQSVLVDIFGGYLYIKNAYFWWIVGKTKITNILKTLFTKAPF